MAAVASGQDPAAGGGGGPSQRAPSPPLPTRHTPLTPGPRASRFQQVLDSSLSHTLGKISWDNFAACYPTIAAHAPAVLRAVQKQMVDRLTALCKVSLQLWEVVVLFFPHTEHKIFFWKKRV